MHVQGLAFSRSLAGALQDAPGFLRTALPPSAAALRRLAGLPTLPPLPAERLRCLRELGLHCPRPRELRLGSGVLVFQPFCAPLDLSALQPLSSLR